MRRFDDRVKPLLEAYRFLNDPDADEKVDCCCRMAELIASTEGEEAAAEWFNRQVRLLRKQANR